jgi:hypothetical protein
MSTRGCVAIGISPQKFVGVYNHSDSYPTWLGKEIWKFIKEKGLDVLAQRLALSDDWEMIENDGYCEYCGQRTFRQPHTISMAMPREENIPDPKCIYHEHQTKVSHYDKEKDLDCFIEWFYLIDIEKKTMTVYPYYYRCKGKGSSVIDLTGYEPDWERIEKIGDES